MWPDKDISNDIGRTYGSAWAPVLYEPQETPAGSLESFLPWQSKTIKE